MNIKTAILGCAHGHAASFSNVWKNNPELGIEVTAVYDHDGERAATLAAALGAAVSSDAEILSDDSITAVVICAETYYHAELTEKAAAAGKSIICYKPMALTLAEADRMAAAVEKYGVLFTLGYQMRVDPQNIKIREIIKNGVIGDIFAYRRRHSLATHNWAGFENSWHVNPALNRDIFADDSAHPIDMLNWVFGLPESVMADITTMNNPKIPNDNGTALFRYPSGLIAEISCYFACSAAEITTEVYGSKGAVAQYYGDAVSTRLPRPAGQPGLKWFVEGNQDWTDSGIASPASHGERISAQAYPFAEFLKGERGPICSVSEARDSLRMVLACYLSAREGRRVFLNDERLYEI